MSSMSTISDSEAMDGPGEFPVPPLSLFARAKKLATEKMSYALGDQVVFSAGNLAVAALLSRAVPSREFGIFVLTQRSLDVMIQLCNVFMWAPFVYNLPHMKHEREPEYMGSIYLHQTLMCVLVGLLFYAGEKWAHTAGRGLYYGVFNPLVLTAGIIIFREYNRRIYFGQMRFRTAFWTDVATNGLQALGVFVLWRMGRLNVASALWVLAGGAFVVSAYWFASEWKRLTISLRAAWQDLVLNFKLGRWFFGSNMLFTISVQVNPWVLSGLLGGVSVADYSRCEYVTNVPRVALVSLQNVMAPMMARAMADGGKEKLNKLVMKIDKLVLFGSIVCAVIIALIGPWVARLLLKTVPGNARTILILLSLNLIAFSASLAKTYGLSAMDKAGKTFYANAAGFVVQACLCYWFIRWLHVPGAAAALLLGTATVALARHYFYRSEMVAA
jgi:O-antigen/teichoic acid export membrane protein